MKYFAYGTNIDPRRMLETCPDGRQVGIGRLDGYAVEFNVYSDRWAGGAVNLEPDPDAHVWGVVWEVTEQDVAHLDTYVGHPTFFRQEHVNVSMAGEEVECITYRVAHQKGYVRPTDDYVNMLRSAMRQQGLPPEALDMLEQAARPPRPRIGT